MGLKLDVDITGWAKEDAFKYLRDNKIPARVLKEDNDYHLISYTKQAVTMFIENGKIQSWDISPRSPIEGITNPSGLREVIEIAKLNNEDYHEAIYAIHKYKWTNWYLNIHIKIDTPADAENTLIFESLKTDYPKIHQDVEDNISMELERLKTGTPF